MSALTLSLPTLQTKSEKVLTQLRDSLRIMYWQAFKSDNKELVGDDKAFSDYLKLYEAFNELWKNHEIHVMNLAEIREFIRSLEYSEVDLTTIRKEYYEKKRGITATIKAEFNDDEVTEVIPY
ncbi:MAG: hypothetical protein ACKN9E_10000 [Microcystaceae cyanobacterium]